MAKYLDYAGLQYLWTKIKNYVSTQPLGANVRYDAQTLTTAQQEQARSNIDAGKNGAWSNPNLLDNAYFVGGGSQLGDGVFPINQRGQTSYNGGITGFDRWTVDGGDFTATLESGGVRVTSTTPYAGMSQIMPAYKLQNGETYTYSIVVDGVLHTATFVANSDGNWANIYYGEDWYVPYQFVNGKWTFKIINTLTSNGMNHLVSKAKIEKGTVSTLANDVPPDFGEELLKCQRYFVRLTADIIYQSFGLGITDSANGTSASYTVPIPLPTSLRAATTNVTFSNIAGFDGTAFHTISSILLIRISGTVPVATIVFSLLGSFTNGQPVLLLANQAGAYIDISAEL